MAWLVDCRASAFVPRTAGLGAGEYGCPQLLTCLLWPPPVVALVLAPAAPTTVRLSPFGPWSRWRGARKSAARAAMSQADAKNSRLSAKRRFGSFHLVCDHRERRSSFRMRLKLAQVFNCPCDDPMTGLFSCHYMTQCSHTNGLGRLPRPLPRFDKSPRTRCGQARANRLANGDSIQRAGCVTILHRTAPSIAFEAQKRRPESRPPRSCAFTPASGDYVGAITHLGSRVAVR
jgi:hypothetical protein